jgi:predicted trehalose synthase
MNAILFDTLKLSRTLRDKGHFTTEQAETLAEALGEAQHGDLATKADLASLATKADIASFEAKIDRVEAALETKIDHLEAALETKTGILETRIGPLATKAELAEVKADILKWIVGAIGFQTIVIVGALITLVRIFVR